MSEQPPAIDHGPRAYAAAIAVHVFTASGAALGLLAMLAAVERRWALMFGILGLALVVDGVDGALARRYRVAEIAPRWSGDTLDLVVDILTYVFVPAYAVVAGDLVPQPLAIPLGMLIVVTGVLYFADRGMKGADNYFYGFPGVWNAVVFYLFLLRPDPWIATLTIMVLAALTFVPIPFLHPFRVTRFRVVTIGLLALWTVLAIAALARDFAPGPWVTGGLVLIGLYFLAAGLLRRPDAA